MDLGVGGTRAFSAALGSNVLGAFVMYGIFFFTSQYFQLVLGMSPLESGLWNLPGLLAMMVVSSAIVPRLATRFRPGYLVAGGMTICAVGFALLTRLDAGDGLALFVLASTITSIGIAPGSTLGTNLIVGSAPAESAGAAHDTLGGAVAVAGQLPPGLLDAANVAFTSGMHAAAAVCTVAMVAVAAITARFLRHVPVAGAAEQAVEAEQAGDRAVVTQTPSPEPA